MLKGIVRAAPLADKPFTVIAAAEAASQQGQRCFAGGRWPEQMQSTAFHFARAQKRSCQGKGYNQHE